MRRWSFAKGHGTENDFVLLLDRESMLTVGPAEVRAICDRRAGVGGDGLLRAVLAKHIDGWEGDGSLWFMDYRNADGSVAEMCGNGVRVFVRFLLELDLAAGPEVVIATRAGLRQATVLPGGLIRASMGAATVRGRDVTVQTGSDERYPAYAVDVGNPHAVSFVADLTQLDLQPTPTWAPAESFPDGVNLEFVVRRGERHLALRVVERGVGETRSCGTGVVAAVAAAEADRPTSGGGPIHYTVDVPGGRLEVELAAGQTYLTGPAVLVAHGELTLPEAA